VSGTCLLSGIMNRAQLRNEPFPGLVEMVGEAIVCEVLKEKSLDDGKNPETS